MSEEKKRVGAGVGVILERDGKILLGRRNPDPDKADSAFRSAGEWCLPGGKLDWGETLILSELLCYRKLYREEILYKKRLRPKNAKIKK